MKQSNSWYDICRSSRKIALKSRQRRKNWEKVATLVHARKYVHTDRTTWTKAKSRVPRRIEREKERATWPKRLNKDGRKGLAPGPTSFSQEFHQVPHYVDIKGNPGTETVSLTHWHSLWTTGCAVLPSFLYISRDSRFSLAEIIRSLPFVSVHPPLSSIRYRCYPPIGCCRLAAFLHRKIAKVYKSMLRGPTMGSRDLFIFRESKGWMIVKIKGKLKFVGMKGLFI